MNILGIVAEYNPFHHGHLHHLNEAKRLTGSEAAICVMGGHFLQRGEPALLNKWARAQMALEAGVDLVFELPFAYATRSANLFARGGVALLAATGLVTHLAFGSESGNLAELQAVADILESEPPLLTHYLREELDKGRGFAAARATALRQYLDRERRPPSGELLSRPNNILGLEYLRALKRISSPMQPVTIPRLGPAYHSSSLAGPGASASAIRAWLSSDAGLAGCREQIQQAMPPCSREILCREIEAGRAPVSEQSLSRIALASLRRSAPGALRAIPDVETGLEHRIMDAANEAATLSELVSRATTRRYPASRIRRIIVHFLVGLTRDKDEMFQSAGGPQYLRLLGFTARGRKLLRLLRDTAALPLVLRPAISRNQFAPAAREMLSLDTLATDLYVLLHPNRDNRGGLDFRRTPVRVD